MGGKPRARTTPEQILAGRPKRVVTLANQVRRQLLGMIDGVEESGDPAAGVIRFSRRGQLAVLHPADDHVRLTLVHGAVLPDFGGLLEGQGPGARSLTIRSARQLGSTAVKTMLSLALFDDDTHEFRRRTRR
jgi:hypothetical protein